MTAISQADDAIEKVRSKYVVKFANTHEKCFLEET